MDNKICLRKQFGKLGSLTKYGTNAEWRKRRPNRLGLLTRRAVMNRDECTSGMCKSRHRLTGSTGTKYEELCAGKASPTHGIGLEIEQPERVAHLATPAHVLQGR
jgi:hypothetical protein